MAAAALTLAFTLLAFSSFSFIQAQNGGFSVELIHRDSPKSPFYNPSESTSSRVSNALKRSFNRANRFRPSSVSTKAAEADLIADNGEYLLNISIGTPPFDIVAIADTGSDLIWTQCLPCTTCFKQDAPRFNPNSSSTYRKLSCSSSSCQESESMFCSDDNTCGYSVTYGDGSFSNGDVATDTLTLPSTTSRPVKFPTTVFGCGTDNGGTFDESTSGIVGLGGGSVSLISQLESSIAGKFSYCLLPISEAGKSNELKFGSNAVVSGPGTVTTPLTKKFPNTFYFLTLEAISVEYERINFTGSSFGSGDGNIIIDSGTTLNLVPDDFYSQLEDAVSSRINATRTQGPVGLSLCYEGTDFAVPSITVHFINADVPLKPLNTFVQISDSVTCFTFASNSEFAIYGNLAQINFLVGYDLQKQTISFKPTDCTKN